MVDTQEIFTNCDKLLKEKSSSLFLQQLDKLLVQISHLHFIVQNLTLHIDLQNKVGTITSHSFAGSDLFVQNVNKIFELCNDDPRTPQYRFLQLRNRAIIHCTYYFSIFKITLTSIKPQVPKLLRQLGLNDATVLAIRTATRNSKIIVVSAPREGGATTTQGAILKILKEKCCAIDYADSKWPQNTELIPVKLEVGRNCNAILNSLNSKYYQAIAYSIRDDRAIEHALNLHKQGNNLVLNLWSGRTSPLQTIRRLNDLGLSKNLDSLGLVMAQYLVPKMCQYCLQPYILSLQLKNLLVDRGSNSTYYFASGCKRCEESDYHDQVLIYENWIICDEFRDAFSSNASDDILTNIVKKTATFEQVAWRLVQQKQLHLDIFLQITQ